MIENTGGPAFPSTIPERMSETSDPYQISYPGMTLRDYLAGQALAGFIAVGAMGHATTDAVLSGLGLSNEAAEALVAQASFRVSDAMLKERNK